MHINQKQLVLLILAVFTIIITIVVDIFFYRSIVSRAIRSSSMAKEVSLETSKKVREKELKADYKKSELERGRISTFIISQDKLVTFIEGLEEIGVTTGTEVNLSSISSITTSPVGEFRARIDISGSWDGVMKALTLVENIPYSISINNLKLNQSSDTGTGELMKVPSGTQTKTSSKNRTWKLSFDMGALTTK